MRGGGGARTEVLLELGRVWGQLVLVGVPLMILRAFCASGVRCASD